MSDPKIGESCAERTRKDRKNAAARAKRAATRVARHDESAHLPQKESQPCPFCDKTMPGVSVLRADNETLVCSECGTKEAPGEKCPRAGIDKKAADKVDGYDRDDLGESPDY